MNRNSIRRPISEKLNREMEHTSPKKPSGAMYDALGQVLDPVNLLMFLPLGGLSRGLRGINAMRDARLMKSLETARPQAPYMPPPREMTLEEMLKEENIPMMLKRQAM